MTLHHLLQKRPFLVCILLTAWLIPLPTTKGLADSSDHMPMTEESVIINNVQYPVPKQWQGKAIRTPHFPSGSFRQIPPEFTKNQTKLYVQKDAETALRQMLEQARADNISLQVESGFRSVGYQKQIFQRMLEEGRTYADIVRYVAPPGYSQHALGTAVDFYPSDWHFADLPHYQWLKDNAGKFGFSETYSKHNRFNLPWEAWHWSYTGKKQTSASAQSPQPQKPK